MRLRAIVLFICFGLVVASFPAIRIIENTSKKFTFEWTTDNLRIVQSAAAPASVSFAGANVDLGDNGEPVIPAYSMYVGVPRQGAISVRLVAAATHGEQLKQPLRLRNAPGLGPRYPGLRFTGSWISEPEYVNFGRLRSGRFIIRPIVYDKESNSIRVLDRAQCTIEFPPAPQAAAAPVPPTSDYGHMLKRLILNYQVAAGWAAAAGMPKRAAVKEFPLVPSQSMISFRVGDGHSGLNEGTIDENGIIRIMASDIVRILGSAPSMDQVALYASYKGIMPTDVPELTQLPDGVSEVPLLRFDVNKNGLADSSDYFLAYVSSISDWRYDSSSSQYFYNIDPYDDYRHYWITVNKSSALTLAKMGPVTGTALDTFTSSKGHCFLKKSVWPSASQGIDGGLEWAWARLNYYMPSFTIDNVVLPNIDPAAVCSVMVAVGFSLHAPALSMTLGGTAVCQGCQYNGWYPVTTSGNQPLTLTIIPNAKDDTLELKNVEFRYTQKLDMTNTAAMTVFSPERPGIVRYRLTGLSGDLVYIVRIANGDASMALVDTVRTSGTFEWSDTAGIGVRYYLCREQGVRAAPQMEPVAPKSSTKFTVRDLRTPSVPIDYLIVTHPNFLVQAQRLARHKLNVFPDRFKYPMAISIGDIYDQFSGGNTDPAALRNALMYLRSQVSKQWNTSFEYVVLMGLGHYDYRNIATPDTSFIPVAIFRNDKCLEDFFVYLEPGENPESSLSTPDCFLGRIPCQTSQAAAQVVDKIIQMEDPTVADFGGWRNRVLLVADDDMQALKPDQLGFQHMEASENMDTIIEHLQPAVDMRKVYLFEYEWNSLMEKPEATQALINGINNGTSIVNYFGHGSAECWADEHLLVPENIGNMQNNGQYPLIASFSCAVGKFDQPGKRRSLAEYLVLAAKSAAIATISAMREAYASDNEKLANNFFSSAYDTTDTAARTFGEALALAKSQCKDDNEKVYSYLGDPSIQTLRPARRISLSITDNGGKALDTIKALMQVTVKGTVLQKNGTPDAQFGTATKPATVFISMFNPAFVTWRKDNGQSFGRNNVSYKMPGAPIFAGQAHVVNGIFEQRILVPKNVTLDQNGANLTAYAWDGPVVALGCKKDFLFHGFVPLSVSDTSGPTISVRPVYSSGSASADASASKGASSTDGIIAPLPLTLEIMLFDSNGIDIVSTGPDEGLTFEVPGVVARKNINYKFQFSQGDFRRGEAGWTFNEGTITPGTYTLQLSAQDLLGNISKKSISVEITAPLELALYNVFNYPNPMRMGESCRFYFDLSKTVSQSVDDRIKVSIRLFTLSGRLVRVFHDVKRGEPFDGKDNFNNPLSPGVYLYQMIAEDRLQQKVVKSKIEKLAINPPR